MLSKSWASRLKRRSDLVAYLLAAALCLATSHSLIVTERAILTESLHTKGESLARYLASLIGDHVAMGQYLLAEQAAHVARDLDPDVEYVTALGIDGVVYASTLPGLANTRLVGTPFDAAALTVTRLTFRDGPHGVLEIVVPMTSSLAPIGILRLGLSTRTVTKTIRKTELALAVLISLVILLVTLGLRLRARTSELAKANESLKSLDRAKSEFISVASHELRTPLTSINGFLRTILRRGGSLTEEKKLHYLKIMELESQRIIHLVDDLLDLTKIEVGHYDLFRQRADLALLVKTVVDTMAIHRSHVRLEARGCSEPVWTVIDSDGVRQVLLNLVGNAVKYSPDGGLVAVTVRADGDTGTVSVSDQGPGIAAEHFPRIFEKFYRVETAAPATQRALRGSGLGLAIAKSIVEIHGGRIWLRSDPGQGAEFSFTLPLAAAEPGKEESPARFPASA